MILVSFFTFAFTFVPATHFDAAQPY